MRKLVPVLIGVFALGLVSFSAAQQSRPTPFVGDVDELAEQNQDFRHVLHTMSRMQLVVMSLQPGESIGRETHPSIDQCLFIVEGSGRAVLGGRASPIDDESVVCVPAGTEHDIENTGREPMKLFTVYGPPQHEPGTVHHTRADAERAERRASR